MNYIHRSSKYYLNFVILKAITEFVVNLSHKYKVKCEEFNCCVSNLTDFLGKYLRKDAK